MSARSPGRIGNRKRIRHLIDNPPSSKGDFLFEPENDAHWAKYICVLISGFIEQAVREIVLEHASGKCGPRIYKYIDGTWPKSRNMQCDTIQLILANLDDAWSKKFDDWVRQRQRKKEINEIIIWRNRIAHGEESNTNNVTLKSVSDKFKIACGVIDFLEELTS